MIDTREFQEFTLHVFFQGYVTGGRDGVVAVWDPLFEQCLKAFKVDDASMRPGSALLRNLPTVRALHIDGDGKILLGTGNNEVAFRMCWMITCIMSYL